MGSGASSRLTSNIGITVVHGSVIPDSPQLGFPKGHAWNILGPPKGEVRRGRVTGEAHLCAEGPES